MPRYRYKTASITSPKIGRRRYGVASISAGIDLLKAIGSGELSLETEPVRCGKHMHKVRSVLPLGELLEKTREEIYAEFDRETDIARAMMGSAQNRAKANWSWWKVPSDVSLLAPDGVKRLRHYAALVIEGIRIGVHPEHFTIDQSALSDTRLLPVEQRIAATYAGSGMLEQLLVLRPPRHSALNTDRFGTGRR